GPPSTDRGLRRSNKKSPARGRARRFRAEVSETDSRSAHAAAPEQVDDRQQDDRADQGRDESPDAESATGAGRPADERRDQPAADQGADDADDDVEQDALLRVRLHDHAGEPADDAAHDQPNDETHHDSTLLCPWCFGENDSPVRGRRECLRGGVTGTSAGRGQPGSDALRWRHAVFAFRIHPRAPALALASVAAGPARGAGGPRVAGAAAGLRTWPDRPLPRP